MPTTNEVDELQKNCKWTQAILNWHHGVLITGRNGNSIFLPAAGIFVDKEKKLVEIEGRYWTSTAIDNGMALYFLRQKMPRKNITSVLVACQYALLQNK